MWMPLCTLCSPQSTTLFTAKLCGSQAGFYMEAYLEAFRASRNGAVPGFCSPGKGDRGVLRDGSLCLVAVFALKAQMMSSLPETTASV